MSIEGYKRPARPPVPFKERFRAWWNGSGLDAPAAPATVRRTPAAPHTPKEQNFLDPLAPWETPALRIAQLAWGEGYAKPGDTEYILDLAKPLGIDSTMSVMVFGAGLGGGARAIHRKFGAWVTGYEPDHEVAKAARQLSIMAGLEKRADIQHYDLQNFVPRQASYDCVVSTETLFQIEERDNLLAKLESTLKSHGQLAFTDFVLGEGVLANDERLKALSPKPAFWSAEQYTRHLRARNLDLRIAEDITAKYSKLVLDGCAKFAKGGPVLTAHFKAYPTQVITLMDLLATRKAAFDSGLLKVMRFSAIKLNRVKLLSDW